MPKLKYSMKNLPKLQQNVVEKAGTALILEVNTSNGTLNYFIPYSELRYKCRKQISHSQMRNSVVVIFRKGLECWRRYV